MKKSKYEPLPEIADYERPALENYEESDFEPSKKDKEPLSIAKKEPEKIEEPSKTAVSAKKPEEKHVLSVAEPATKKLGVKKGKNDPLPEIADHEKPALEKYEESPFDPSKNEKEVPVSDAKGKESGRTRAGKPKEIPAAKKPEEKPEPVVEEPFWKKLAGMKTKYEPLPEIADYDRPDLEIYEESDFDPTKKEHEPLIFGTREPENVPAKSKAAKNKPKSKKEEELPEVEEYERPALEKYEKTPFEATKKADEPLAIGKGKRGLLPKEEENLEAKPGRKTEETVPGQSFKLNTAGKKGKDPEPEQDTAVTINSPKSPIQKTSTEDSAEAKITPKKQNPQPSVVEEAVSKNVTIKTPVEPEPEEEKPKIRRAKYDPMAYVPDEEEKLKEPEPVSESKPTKKKYDPMAYVPDEEDKPKEADLVPAAQSKLIKKKYDPMAYVPDEEEKVEEPAPAPAAQSKPIKKKYDPMAYVPDAEEEAKPENPWAADDNSIEIKITEPDDYTPRSSLKKRVEEAPNVEAAAAAAAAKKKLSRRKYDPLAYIPDEDEEDTKKQEEPNSILNSSPQTQPARRKYDPFAYVPDDDDLPSVNIEPEVNTHDTYQKNIQARTDKFFFVVWHLQTFHLAILR